MITARINLIVRIFSVVLLFAACTSDKEIPDDHMKAYLTGIDARRCACCGGAMITLSENTERYVEPYYQWYNYAEELDITFNSSFPIPVYIQFETLKDQCGSSLGIVDVKNIELR